MATLVDATRHAGNTITIDIAFEDNGTPVDLTNATVTWVLAKAPGGAPFLTKSSANPAELELLPPETTGIARVYLTPVDTAGLAGAYYHESRAVEAGGTEWVGTYGRLVMLPSSI